MDSKHLLVPIKVQALVIDDIVFNKRGVIEYEKGKYAANDGRWSPQMYNYQVLTGSLNAPGPKPFYGATRKYQSSNADQLVLDQRTTPSALPKQTDRGVYLHWVLPDGLRHAYTPGLLDFPVLPDHWLIVRFSHRDSTVKTKAWFVDGSVVVGENGPGASLLFARDKEYEAQRVGKVVPLEEFANANFPGERATITALGNEHTGSPTFTASIAENRNIFSWHDTLEDLREPNREGKVPEGTTLTYSLIGWYRDPKHEPLSAPAARVTEKRDKDDALLGWLIDPPGWFIDAKSPAPDLLKRRSVFHGMVAHINYWNAKTYKGQILGYPGAPAAGSALRQTRPSIKVGVGNNAEDALVSLVSSEYSGEQEVKSLEKEQPNLWKALEAVFYRQAETLVRSWNVAPRDMTVHQNWFATREAGKIWYIRPGVANQSVFPSEAAKTATETAIRPTADHLAKLKELNQAQADADAASREVAALQQELYARWWKVCVKSHSMRRDEVADEKADCEKIIERVKPLRTRRDQALGRVRTLHEELKSKLPKQELPNEPVKELLELKYDAAPRFWTPADPVVVLKNCGLPTKHRFPPQHPCRLPEEIVTTAEVKVGQSTKQFSTPAGLSEIATAAQKLPACPELLTALLDEASIVQQAIRDLAERSLPSKPFTTEAAWRQWMDQLVNDITWVDDPDTFPTDQIKFGKPNNLNIQAHRLAEVWGQQPWSPLFIDWQITWFPTAHTPTAEHDFAPVWDFRGADFVPLDKKSIPTTGYTVRGRSLLAPIDKRIFNEPIERLRELLHSKGSTDAAFPPAVIEILQRYEIVWDKTLKNLAGAGLMGQALSGFHQALLLRDVTLPRISPDPTRPWIDPEAKLPSLENAVKEQLDAADQEGLMGERLAPPAPTSTPATAIPFSMIRAGALRIDELWLIDDFGQSADLLGLTAARTRSSGQVFHPRIRWHDDPSVVAMPPRVLQPIRLNFRFAGTSESANEDPALSPICGWIFYNSLDQALVLCDRAGELMGHLAIVKDQRGLSVNWQIGAGGMALNNIRNQRLQAFAQSLVESTPTSKPRLVELLNLIDSALERIRPAAGRRDLVLFGRPLALVNASIGLELFGKAWTNPHQSVVTRGQGTGDAVLDAVRVRVNLGYSHSLEDGLVGFFKGGNYERLIATQPPDNIVSSYIRKQQSDPLRAGFGAPEEVTLLMDPWGSVQAACGIVPAKTVTLAHAELDKTVAKIEASFRVGPVLLQGDRIALPTPPVEKGNWNFTGPVTNQTATTVGSFDLRQFSDQPVVATEGRLVLLNEE